MNPFAYLKDVIEWPKTHPRARMIEVSVRCRTPRRAEVAGSDFRHEPIDPISRSRRVALFARNRDAKAALADQDPRRESICIRQAEGRFVSDTDLLETIDAAALAQLLGALES